MKRSLAGCLAVVAASCGACGGDGTTAATSKGTFTRNGVTVTIAYRPAQGELLATFRPDKAGFHLYSKDLPQSGISGVGYPTRARPASGLVLTGIPAASVDPVPLEVQTIGVTLPVYPDGPVTLTEPVRLAGTAAGRAKSATVVVSYAACSHTVCLPPVVDQSIAVALAQA